MSDLHLGRYTPRAHIEAALAACQAHLPDVLLLGGDYVSNERDLACLPVYTEILAGARFPGGTFYVLGNHDYWSGAAQVREAFNQAGLEEVTNRNRPLAGDWHLCGLDDTWEGKPDVESAFRGTEHGRRLVLSHNPKIFRRIWHRDCTAICGHTHGGQIRIPLLPNPALLTGKHPFIQGWHARGNSRMYVNRGIGTVLVPYRVNCPPEITILRLPL